jgi:hypothetical protein
LRLCGLTGRYAASLNIRENHVNSGNFAGNTVNGMQLARASAKVYAMSEFETAATTSAEAVSEQIPAPASRALIVLNERQPTTAAPRRDAAFLAHLLATKAQAPQTRARRRVEPAEALAAYRAAAGILN